MSGIVCALAGTLGRTQIVGAITVAQFFGFSSDIFGYSFGSEFGSNGACGSSGQCVPPGVTTGTSYSIGSRTAASSVPCDFFIRCSSPSGSQNAFRGIRVTRHDDTIREYLTADATFFQSGLKEWRWGDGLNPCWTVDAVGLVRAVEWLT